MEIMICNKCKHEKTKDDFYKGYKTTCKKCKITEQLKKYHEENDGKEKKKRGRPAKPKEEKEKRPRGRPPKASTI